MYKYIFFVLCLLRINVTKLLKHLIMKKKKKIHKAYRLKLKEEIIDLVVPWFTT